MSENYLHPLQSAWLTLESKQTPMHIGALLYFSLPEGAPADFVGQLATAMRDQVPVDAPWTQRLPRHRGFGRALRLETVEELDIDYHFRHSALPAPGGERQIGELVSRLHSHAMDLSKPLWEVHLIEGLHGRRFAIYIKLHAVLFDGAKVPALLQQWLSESAERGEVTAPWTQALPRAKTQRHLLEDWPALLRVLGHRVTERFKPTITWTGLKGVPNSALNDRVSGARRFATQQYSIARLKAVASQLSASPEELLFYLLSSALRRFFKEFNALPDQPMVALVADRSRRDGQVSPLFVSLGTHRADKRKRLGDIQRSLKLARSQFAVLRPEDARAEATADVLPYLIRQSLGIDHRLPPMFNVGVAVVSFGEEERFLNGAKLEAVFPMPMLLQGGALNISLLRYMDSWNVGLCGARDNLPHLQRLAVYMGLALEELEEALSDAE